ncbi:MAG: copper-binding protein, partial [Rubrivivax sp.]
PLRRAVDRQGRQRHRFPIPPLNEEQAMTIKTLMGSIVFAALAAIATPVLAQDTMSDAVVRKIDKEQGKLTLKHGPIKNLDMPGMTMVFSVRDKAMLDTVKPGDTVKFRAENANGKLTVVEMTTTP